VVVAEWRQVSFVLLEWKGCLSSRFSCKMKHLACCIDSRATLACIDMPAVAPSVLLQDGKPTERMKEYQHHDQ
jgi:hypothetical protein